MNDEVKSLYNLSEQFVVIDELLKESGGEIGEGDDNKLDEIMGDLSKKTDGIVGYCKYLDSISKRAAEESKRFSQMKQRIEKRKIAFKNYVLNCMVHMKKQKLESPQSLVSLRQMKKLFLEDDARLPEDCYVTTKRPDKNKIKIDIESGCVFKGAIIRSVTVITVKER